MKRKRNLPMTIYALMPIIFLLEPNPPAASWRGSLPSILFEKLTGKTGAHLLGIQKIKYGFHLFTQILLNIQFDKKVTCYCCNCNASVVCLEQVSAQKIWITGKIEHRPCFENVILLANFAMDEIASLEERDTINSGQRLKGCTVHSIYSHINLVVANASRKYETSKKCRLFGLAFSKT